MHLIRAANIFTQALNGVYVYTCARVHGPPCSGIMKLNRVAFVDSFMTHFSYSESLYTLEMGLHHDSDSEDSNLLANFIDSWMTQVPKKAHF